MTDDGGREVVLAVLTEGLLDDPHAKTAHGVIRYGPRPVVAVVDSRFAGRTAEEVVPYVRRPVPVVATVEEAAARGATRLLIGVAPSGGKLTGAWRETIGRAMAAGLDVEAGLHTVLADDPELVHEAARHGVRLHDLRVGPATLDVPRGPASRPRGVHVVHTVGSDCAIGKMSVVLELDAAARTRGLRSVFVATGQTGIAISGWGTAVDHVIADYIAGAAERLVDGGAQRGDLLFVEGQGALFHPAYSGVTLGLLHGSAPDVLVLAHRAGRTRIEGYETVRIPALRDLVAAYEAVCAPIRPARVAAVALNTQGLGDAEAAAAVEAVAGETGLPTEDVVRRGPDAVLDAVLAALPG